MVIATFIKMPISPSKKCLVSFGPKALRSVESPIPRGTTEKLLSWGFEGSNLF